MYLTPNNEKTSHAQRGGVQRLLRTPDKKAAACMQRLGKGGSVVGLDSVVNRRWFWLLEVCVAFLSVSLPEGQRVAQM